MEPLARNSRAAMHHVHGHLVQLGGLHLAGDRTLPDQLIQATLLVVEIAGHLVGRARHVGGAAGFVGLLRVLRACWCIRGRRAGT